MYAFSGALVPRMLGQRITQAEKSHHNSLTPDQFFTRYTKLEDFFVKILQAGTQQQQLAEFLPALIPVTTMLSKLRPCLNSRFVLAPVATNNQDKNVYGLI